MPKEKLQSISYVAAQIYIKCYEDELLQMRISNANEPFRYMIFSSGVVHNIEDGSEAYTLLCDCLEDMFAVDTDYQDFLKL